MPDWKKLVRERLSVLNLPPGRSYTWVLEISGHTEEDWRLSFATRQAPAAESGQGAPE